MKERLNHISFLQFIGPIFVILGHSTNGMPSSNIWYVFSKEWIYVFHMPLFFFISGYMFSYKGGLGVKTWSMFIFGKIKRLLIPYFVWNLLFIIPKDLMQPFLEDRVELNLSYFLKLIITPRANILGHTWFMMALFLLFTLAPMFNWFLRVKNKEIVWSIVSLGFVVIYFFPINTEVLALVDLSKDTLFFWIGIMFGQVSLNTLKRLSKKPIITSSIFASTVVLTTVRITITDAPIVGISTCFLTILTLLIVPLVFNINSSLIDKMGMNSFGVYIIHWPILLCVRVILYQQLHINSSLVIVAMVICGYIIPNCIIRISKGFKVKKIEKPLYYLIGV